MARIQAKSEFCISCQSPLYQLPESSVSAARVQRNPFIYARKLKIATDLLGQKRDVTWRHRRNWANNTGGRSVGMGVRTLIYEGVK